MMDDRETTVADLKQMVREFRDRREWKQFHTPKNLSMAIAVEAAELMEEFLWLDSDEELRLAEDSSRLEQLGAELADILIYALSFANSLGLDVTTAVSRKLARNEQKYPESEYRGKSSWLDSENGG
jgi:dCTP diphosphatase